MSYDVALGPGPQGRALAHTIDCPFLRHQADDLSLPVMTMLGCEAPLPAWVEQHTCLTGVDEQDQEQDQRDPE